MQITVQTGWGGGERGDGCHPFDLLGWLPVIWSGAPHWFLGGRSHNGLRTHCMMSSKYCFPRKCPDTSWLWLIQRTTRNFMTSCSSAMKSGRTGDQTPVSCPPLPQLLKEVPTLLRPSAWLAALFFSKIDFVKAYRQIHIAKADIPKKAIATPFGLFWVPFHGFWP